LATEDNAHSKDEDYKYSIESPSKKDSPSNLFKMLARNDTEGPKNAYESSVSYDQPNSPE